MIDLRSDTLSRPTPAMRRAMAEADVGDDCFGEDPTVNALERRVAEILGKEDAVYMPTGTMTNQVAIRAHTEAGDAVLMDQSAHIYLLEAGAACALSGAHPKLLPGAQGVFTPADVAAAVPPRHPYFPATWTPPAKLLCIENTHNAGSGRIWPLAQLRAVCETGRSLGLRLHLDGARLWNAAVATGIAEKTWSEPFDSVSVCFSKGLGAPMGSALAGSAQFVARARRFKALFGGGLRQAGIVAAAALYAIEHHRELLLVDHANARLLAEGLLGLPAIDTDLQSVQSNIVVLRTTRAPAGELVVKLFQAGVHVLPTGRDTIRAVTCLNVSKGDILEAIRVIRRVAGG